MNGKEKFAGAVLLLTLAIGIIIEVFDGPPAGESVSRQVCQWPVDVDEGRDDGFRKIDVNKATGEDLQILPGIGPRKAEAIVKYRENHGSFTSLTEISEVKGIGPKTLDRIAPYVVVGKEEGDREGEAVQLGVHGSSPSEREGDSPARYRSRSHLEVSSHSD